MYRIQRRNRSLYLYTCVLQRGSGGGRGGGGGGGERKWKRKQGNPDKTFMPPLRFSDVVGPGRKSRTAI